MILYPERRNPCGECGFDPRTVSPADGAVAARSFPRRWRELFERVAEHDDHGDALLHSPLGEARWRPVDRVRRVVRIFDRLSTQLEHIWAKDDPYLDRVDVPEPAASSADGALAELDRAAERLAEVIERFEGEQWDRTGRRIGGQVTAVQVMHEAVHEGIHHLRACQRDLEQQLDCSLDGEEEADA